MTHVKLVDKNALVTFAEAQEDERELLRRAAEGPAATLFKIWRTHQALVVPRGMPSRDRFHNAAANSERRGWPVFERDTGGDLTPQMPGVVNISMAFRMDGATPNIKAAYLRLTAPVLSFIEQQLGLKAYLSAIPGAFCDGAYNIAIEEKKVAGTAQRWKLLSSGDAPKSVAVLGHIALICDCDLAPAIGVINDFYTACGIEKRVEFKKHITLRQLMGVNGSSPAMIAQALESHLRQHSI